MKKWALNAAGLFLAGALLGLGSKWLDVFSAGNRILMLLEGMFSGFSVWVLLGVLITRHSSAAKRAMVYIPCFCFGMLLAYYITAELLQTVYGWAFIKGWTVFSLLSPLFAFLTWQTRWKGALPTVLALGVLFADAAGCYVLQRTFYLTDFVLVPLLAFVLFFKRQVRSEPYRARDEKARSKFIKE